MTISFLRVTDTSLFDVSNMDPDGQLSQRGTQREVMLRCNYHFHADSAFNPRRAGLSLLLAHQLPPPGTGGATAFADSRAAYDALPEETKEKIKDYVVMNSQHQCRKAANPGNPLFSTKEVSPYAATADDSTTRCRIGLANTSWSKCTRRRGGPTCTLPLMRIT